MTEDRISGGVAESQNPAIAQALPKAVTVMASIVGLFGAICIIGAIVRASAPYEAEDSFKPHGQVEVNKFFDKVGRQLADYGSSENLAFDRIIRGALGVFSFLLSLSGWLLPAAKRWAATMLLVLYPLLIIGGLFLAVGSVARLVDLVIPLGAVVLVTPTLVLVSINWRRFPRKPKSEPE